MKSKRLSLLEKSSYLLVFETGDEVMKGLANFAREEGLLSAHFTAIGAFSSAIVGWYDPERKGYKENSINEQMEVTALVGNVSYYEGKPKLHAHVALANPAGAALGGHLIEGHVRPTLELFLTATPEGLTREMDEATGLPLIKL